MTTINNQNTVGTQQEMRRRLLHHVVQDLDESVIRTAVDGLSDLLSLPLCDEMVEELLSPIFNWSDFWPQYMAKQILGLPPDDEYGWEELLERFEAREGVESRSDQADEPNWTVEGF